MFKSLILSLVSLAFSQLGNACDYEFEFVVPGDEHTNTFDMVKHVSWIDGTMRRLELPAVALNEEVRAGFERLVATGGPVCAFGSRSPAPPRLFFIYKLQ